MGILVPFSRPPPSAVPRSSTAPFKWFSRRVSATPFPRHFGPERMALVKPCFLPFEDLRSDVLAALEREPTEKTWGREGWSYIGWKRIRKAWPGLLPRQQPGRLDEEYRVDPTLTGRHIDIRITLKCTYLPSGWLRWRRRYEKGIPRGRGIDLCGCT